MLLKLKKFWVSDQNLARSDALPTQPQRFIWGAKLLVKFLSIPAGHASRIYSLKYVR